MTKRSHLIVLAILTLAGAAFAAPPAIKRARNPASNAYIITLDAKVPAVDNAEILARRVGATLGHVYDVVMNGFSIRGTEQQALALLNMPGVVEVSEVGQSYPADVMYNPPKGLDRIDQRDLPLSGSFSFSTYTTPTNIYVVDTGIDPHPDFGTRLVANKNFARNPSTGVLDPNDYTDYGLPLGDTFHGTASAVIAAGDPHGIARWAKIYNVRVCSAQTCFGDDVIAGVNYVTQQRNARPSELHVANASFSGNDSGMMTAFVNSIDAGVAWSFAAGNGYDRQNGADACDFYPASIAASKSGAISVGASLATTDAIEIYSNQGPCVEIFGPDQTEWASPKGFVASGTSASAPHVAGVLAARWANSPTSTAAEIEGVIKGIATPGVLTNIWPTSPNLLLYSVLPRRRPS